MKELNIKQIENDLKSDKEIDEDYREQIIEHLANSIGKKVHHSFSNVFKSEITASDLPTNLWEFKNKIRYLIKSYVDNSSKAPLEKYVYKSLKRFYFQDILLKSHMFIRSQQEVGFCPICKYKEYLELANPYWKIYKCHHCEQITKSEVSEEQKSKHLVFSLFTEMACLCPQCENKVPISSLNGEESWMDSNKISNIIHSIENNHFVDDFLIMELKCPYCDNIFNPSNENKTSLAKKSYSYKTLPIVEANDFVCDMLAERNLSQKELSIPAQKVHSTKKANILIDELILKLSNIEPNSFNRCIKRYLYYSQILWIKQYWNYAIRYFFEKEDILGIDVHKTMFSLWLDVIESNMLELRKFDSIKSVQDLKWFCREPNFSAGPIDSFNAVVLNNYRIKNNTNLVDYNSNHNVRIAKILSINRIQNESLSENNFLENVLTFTWQDIIINPKSELNPGDNILIKAIMMSGHPCHAPIKAMLRVRSEALSGIIKRVANENDNPDLDFWKFRANKINRAKEKTKLDIKI